MAGDAPAARGLACYHACRKGISPSAPEAQCERRSCLANWHAVVRTAAATLSRGGGTDPGRAGRARRLERAWDQRPRARPEADATPRDRALGRRGAGAAPTPARPAASGRMADGTAAAHWRTSAPATTPAPDPPHAHYR